MKSLPQMTPEEVQGVRERMREQFSFTPQTHNASGEEASRGTRKVPAKADTPIVSSAQEPEPEPVDNEDDDTHTAPAVKKKPVV
jgi:hypothetical protein